MVTRFDLWEIPIQLSIFCWLAVGLVVVLMRNICNDSDFIDVKFDSVNVEPKGASNSFSPNNLDNLSGLTTTSTEFERDEIELTRSEEIEEQQREFERDERDEIVNNKEKELVL